MSRRYLVLPVLFTLAILLSGCALSLPNSSSTSTSAAGGASVAAGDLSLITEPDAGIGPVQKFIASAHHSVDVVMYEFEDSSLEHTLAADVKRGIKVRVLLNDGQYGAGFPQNQNAYNYFLANHVPVHWTPSYFALTHQKTVIVDDKTALIMTFNFTPQYYASSREFGVFDHDGTDVHAVVSAFNDDWSNNKSKAGNGVDLVWSPGSTSQIVSVISSARHSLDIYNEEMASKTIIKALIAAAHRGVNVRVVMTDQSTWHSAFHELTSAGVHVHTFAANASLYIHAKMVLADNHRVFVGSENFSTFSMTRNRELGIIFTAPHLIDSMRKTFDGDFDNSRPFS